MWRGLRDSPELSPACGREGWAAERGVNPPLIFKGDDGHAWRSSKWWLIYGPSEPSVGLLNVSQTVKWDQLSFSLNMHHLYMHLREKMVFCLIWQMKASGLLVFNMALDFFLSCRQFSVALNPVCALETVRCTVGLSGDLNASSRSSKTRRRVKLCFVSWCGWSLHLAKAELPGFRVGRPPGWKEAQEIKCHGRDVIYTWEQEANVLEKKECWRW